MGYFSNGSEGMDYQERYCLHCVNYRDLNDGRGPGCPVWDLHFTFNYDGVRDPKVGGILDRFIPRKEGENQECRMFKPADDQERRA